MTDALFQNPGVCLFQGRLEIFRSAENVEHELLQRRHRQGTGNLAAPVSAHAIGNQEQVAAAISKLNLRLRQTRLQNPHRSAEVRDQEMIFVRLADKPTVRPAPYDPTKKQKSADKTSRIPVKVVQAERLKKPEWIRVKAAMPAYIAHGGIATPRACRSGTQHT